eukprot:CAMPEP_0119558578 /NCGR_PEP_ID=MMETSP1352-20130426/10877_1 /TAXON_ID=265584 /ORGANISM="Stauroneis constricta, Strain CCMP1120" /LENGTH=57 /DNA_ID=CAMNT_0007605973 /DNA_START=232 /DNA_END=401 /DNA_ORIENTATION=+
MTARQDGCDGIAQREKYGASIFPSRLQLPSSPPEDIRTYQRIDRNETGIASKCEMHA